MANASHRQAVAMPEALSTRAARLEPFDWYREMRAETPVRYDDDRRVWDVFRYDDVRRVLADSETFAADPSRTDGIGFTDGARPQSLRGSDPPRSALIQSLDGDRFQSDTVDALAPHVRGIADELLDDATDGGRLDVVGDLAAPLSAVVVAELLGVPTDDRDRFEQWSAALVTDAGTGATAERPHGTIREVRAYVADRLEQRRAIPRDDLLTHVATTGPDGHRPSEGDVLNDCLDLLGTATATTTALVGNAVRSLDEQPTRYEEVAGDRDALAATIEEVLRYRSPVQALPRVATTDTELRGHAIEAGDPVVAWLGSANRDEAQFDDPDAFRPDRRPTGHVAFGHDSHCGPDGSLTRLQARVALGRLLARLDGIEVVDEPLEPMPSAFYCGVERLPIRFDAAD
ncbi:cytochrome P450 [Halorientalis salina]|uniref:cytochrome P450 n=1 Tax=Halorientalis salina TaxID=2932266 RepID=UPI0010ABC895|nr:cytochrome P450 [Halorientalis salina]